MRGARPGRALDALVRSAAGAVRDATVVVACSGGPDSVALAAIFDRLARAGGFGIVLAHVNAGLRESAWQDECIVLSVGARLGRAVRIAAPPPGGDDEATLRTARYAALCAIATECGAQAIATAHTAEDQTETVLLSLFRGTGLNGLAGIAPRTILGDGHVLLRPLLRVTHRELMAEVARSGLPYALDPTNADPRYRRNAVREALIRLRSDFPQLDRSVARCAHIVRAEVSDDERARARRALRVTLAQRGTLRDVPFERIEAALDARSGRVFIKRGVDLEIGDSHERH